MISYITVAVVVFIGTFLFCQRRLVLRENEHYLEIRNYHDKADKFDSIQREKSFLEDELEELKQAWEVGRKESIIHNTLTLFKMFFTGYSGTDIPKSEALVKAMRDTLYFSGSEVYTPTSKDTMNLMFNEMVLKESELFDYLQKVYTRLLRDFKLSDFYTSDEIAEKEGLFNRYNYGDDEDEWEHVREVTAKLKKRKSDSLHKLFDRYKADEDEIERISEQETTATLERIEKLDKRNRTYRRYVKNIFPDLMTTKKGE